MFWQFVFDLKHMKWYHKIRYQYHNLLVKKRYEIVFKKYLLNQTLHCLTSSAGDQTSQVVSATSNMSISIGVIEGMSVGIRIAVH